jgi:ubiquinone biosynthesis protein
VFHADPHAGNLLYNERRGELIVLDWALTGRLAREERRHLARLILMMTMRDAAGVRASIHALSRSEASAQRHDGEIIDRTVEAFFKALPHACSLGAIDAMRLLDRIGVEGVRFPGALVLIRKVIFTLDGVLGDIAGDSVRIDTIVAREFLVRWIRQLGALPAPFGVRDLLAVQRSVFNYATGLWAWA